MSFLEDDIVLYAPTPSSKRENFTLAHEFGHWLIERNGRILDFIADHEDPAKLLETVCDRVAQELLLPDKSLKTLRGEPVRASDVVALYEATAASRPVCAIALGQRLPRLGAIVIIDVDLHQVTASCVHPDPEHGWPRVFPWPGQPIPAGHPFTALRSGATLTRKSFWRTPWNAEQSYYIDAVHDGRRIIAVFSETDLWQAERLHLDGPTEFSQRPQAEIYCCGRSQLVQGYPCTNCGEHYCPVCKRCRCERLEQKEVLCQGSCYMRYLPHLLVNGLCLECRE